MLNASRRATLNRPHLRRSTHPERNYSRSCRCLCCRMRQPGRSYGRTRPIPSTIASVENGRTKTTSESACTRTYAVINSATASLTSCWTSQLRIGRPRLKPDVRPKTNLQRVNTVDPEREYLLLGHDGRPVALEVTEQGEVAAVDDDPMLECRRDASRLRLSNAQRSRSRR